MTTHTISDIIAATYVAKDADGKTNSYYALILSKCKRYANKSIGTMAVAFDKNGKLVLLYNPEFLARLTDGEAIAAVKHEAMHIFFKHLARFQTKKNQQRVNIATDMAINQYLRGLPQGCVYPETYHLPNGLSADAYLKALEEQNACSQDKMQIKGKGQSQGGGGGGGGGGQGNNQGQGGGQGQGDNQDQDQENGDGQGNAGNHDTWNKVVDENGNIIGTTDEMGVDTESTLDRIARSVAQVMKSQGNAPSWAQAEVDNLDKKSVHDWRHELRVLCQSVLSTDKRRSQKRINRRLACITTDFLFPGKKKDRKPSVLLVRDTSGSMFCEETQAAVLTEMIAISQRAEVLVCDCDTEIHQVYKVRKKSDFKKYEGGGGTSFVKPFEEAK